MSNQKLYAGLIGGVLMLGLTLSNQAMAGKDVTEAEVPAPVVKAFKELYPKAVQVEWEYKKVTSGELKGVPMYEVEFEDELGVDHEVIFDPDGKMLKSKLD
ncbi:MAG: hypothetical protein ACXW1Z_15355 [Methylobacter sp.]